MTERELEDARRGMERLESDQNLAESESSAIEAIILPKQRPVVFVQDGHYEAPGWPFEHLDRTDFRRRIETNIPSTGRIELPDSDAIPFGGTGC